MPVTFPPTWFVKIRQVKRCSLKLSNHLNIGLLTGSPCQGNVDKIADGICDPENNNEDCGLDGGDCSRANF